MASKTPNYDAKVKTILDALEPGERVCALTGEKWEMTEEEIGWYKKFNVPPHGWAPVTRLKYMMGFPSGIAIWKKPHAKTGEPILSFIHPDSPFQVIPDKEWFQQEMAQDKKELDPERSFFEQITELSYKVPAAALRDDGSSVNTVGVDMLNCQDTYLIFGGYNIKSDMYVAITYEGEHSCLLTNTKKVNHSFMINACADLHNCRYCFQNGKLVNCTFCFASRNLENCYGASNQEHKKYLFWNEQLSQGEWEKRVSEIDLSDQDVWDREVARFHKMVTEEAFWRYRWEKEPNEDCTGEYFMECVRCHDCYWLDLSTDLYRCWMGVEARDSAFSLWIGWGDQAYLSTDLATYNNIKFSMRVWRCQNMEYSIDCYDCENCFGCVGLQKKKFHIFNKSYSEEEYWRRVDEIKCAMLERGEYGQFFPAHLSQGGFQFSMGEFFLGYTEEELKTFGAPTFDPQKGNVEAPGEVLRSSDLPRRLADIDPSKHIGKPILDESIGRMYTITSSEYAFYQKHQLPVPREHFLMRLTNLIRHSNGPIPEEVACAKCGDRTITHRNALFSGRRKTLCRTCYLKYIEERE